MVEPLLAVDNVSCWFGGLKAVDGASLSAPPGRITALIGPNGAGSLSLACRRARTSWWARIFITGHAMPRLRLPTVLAAISA